MEKENEIKTMVPTLRFPEFREQTGWEVEFLSNILDYERPDNFIVETETYGEEGIPVLTANKSFILGYTRESTGIYVNLPVIIFDDFTTDKKYVDFPFKVKSSAIKILHTKHTDILRFIYELMNQITFEAKEHKRYYISTYQRIQVPLPKEEEQQKIADCLSSIDDLIEATAQKVKTLKEHKKGLMQRLFPAKGKNVPDLRFPEFQGMKGWEKKQVKDFGEVITGNTPSKKEGKYWNGDFVWVTAQDFKGKYINDSILKLTKFGKDKARVIPKDSVLVTCIASIGLNAINKVECSTNQQINTICCNKEYYYEYVYYLVTYNTKNLKQLAGQTAVPIITKKSFEEFEVYAIDNYDEQQKIADSLSSLDELIEVISRKVEILKEYKKGLMQQLFPKI